MQGNKLFNFRFQGIYEYKMLQYISFFFCIADVFLYTSVNRHVSTGLIIILNYDVCPSAACFQFIRG